MVDLPSVARSRRQFLRAGASLAAAPALAAWSSSKARARDLPPERKRGPLRDAYALERDLVYLNHASVGTVPIEVLERRERRLREVESNPWLHVFGGRLDDERARARERIAGFLGARADATAVLRNTTEAFHVLAHGLPWRAGDEIVFSSLNHIGASACFERFAVRAGARVRRFPFPEEDAPSLTDDDLVRLHQDALSDDTRLLVIPHVDNVVGVRLPVARIAAVARQRGVEWVAVDGAQSAGTLPLDVSAMGADLFATSAHKWIQAPKGTGVAVFSDRVREALTPMFVTWGEAGWRGTGRAFEDVGTADPTRLLALADAVAFQERIDQGWREQRLRDLRDRVREHTDARPRLRFRSPRAFERGSPLVSIGLPDDVRADQVFQRLFERRRIVFRPFATDGQNAIRISPNLANTEGEIDGLFEGLDDLL